MSEVKIERLERVAIDVHDLEEAAKFFSDVFGTKFDRLKLDNVKIEEMGQGDPATRVKLQLAMSPLGIELIQSDPPVKNKGLRSFHLKVPNLAAAEEEMKRKGIQQLAHAEFGGLKEAIFNSEDMLGVRLVLVEYSAATALDATKE